MVAWLEYGNGETPESTQMKGDHFVGNTMSFLMSIMGQNKLNWWKVVCLKKIRKTSTIIQKSSRVVASLGGQRC